MAEQSIVEEFIDAVKQKPADKNRIYSAEIARIDNDGTVWVYLAGSDKETPTARSSVEVKKGDKVNVEWRNNKLYIAGNYSNPSAGVVRVANVEAAANTAKEAANNAVADAGRARDAAEQAEATAAGVADTAARAEESAGRAETAAGTAQTAADTAVSQLSVIENVVGVLDLIQKHGDYQHNTDLEAVPDKWYFTKDGDEYIVQPNVTFEYVLTSDQSVVQDKPYYTRTGTGTEEDPYVYTQVEDPVDADLGTYYENTGWNYYVLAGIDTAIQNYVSSHLTIAGDSLFLKNGNTMVQLSTQNGMTLYNSGGYPVANYGSDATIGDPNEFHIKITNSRISFFIDPIHEVAYVSGDKLYITQTIVLQQMDVGEKHENNGLGQWSWRVHTIENLNNLYLKWAY